jgi:hypothetical protein
VASHRPEVISTLGTFEDWPHAYGSLRLNPLYAEDGQDGDGTLNLRRVFPSAWYEQENAEYRYEGYLPETASIKQTVLRDLAEGKRTPEVETLLQGCVVVGVPERYIDQNFSRSSGVNDHAQTEISGTFYVEKIRISELISMLVPPGDPFILVDGNSWAADSINGRRAIPFLERDGQYWGPPSDDETAISEMERLRELGAGFIVFGEPAVWWLDYYAGFTRYLYSNFRCVLQHKDLVMFDLRS